MQRIAHEEPHRPRSLDRRVPRDLETIVLKAIDKEPEHRYASAGDLAEDLRRFLADLPIQARRTSVAERTWRWCRRNRAVAVLTAAMVALLVVAVVGLAVANLLITVEKNQKVEALRQAKANEKAAIANLKKARAAVDQMLTAVGQNQRSAVPQMEPVRRALLIKALGFYQDFLGGTVPIQSSGSRRRKPGTESERFTRIWASRKKQ